MDEIARLRQARPVAAPPADAALQAGRAKLIEATRQPIRQRHERQTGRAGQPGRSAAPAGTPRRPRRPAAIAAGSAVLAGTAVAAAVLTGGTSAPSHPQGSHHRTQIVTVAWTVQVSRDHTVTITVRQLRDPAGLQRTLRQEGIPAIVRYIPLATKMVDGQEVTGPACDYLLPVPDFPPSAARAVIVSSPSGSSAASLARPTPTPSASPIPRPTPSASPVTHPLTGGTLLAVITVRQRLLPSGAAIFISSAITKAGAAAADFGVSLLGNGHLPRCVPLGQ
jgi:hypothetical protein